MDKNCLVDVDGLIRVLQAIKDGKPVEYRLLEDKSWFDFDPTECEIDTENYKYRVKPKEYPDIDNHLYIPMRDLEEGRIYKIIHKKARGQQDPDVFGYVCVRVNLCSEDKDDIIFHFMLTRALYGRILYVIDDKCEHLCSERTANFANIIAPYYNTPPLADYVFAMATKKEVAELDDILRQVGYEFKDYEMQKIDWNKE